MTGSLLQLQAQGNEKVRLTENPEINVFRYVYYRYINFTTEIIQTNLNEIVNFGKYSSCNILKKGHLLSKMHLQITLPPLQNANGTYLSWSDTLGYAIFDGPIELLVDGVVIDRLYPVFMDVWDELSTSKSKRDGRNLMILKSDVFRSNLYNATQQTTLMIPLEFWFTKDYSLALPLLALYTNDIKIQFTLRNITDCINYDGTQLPANINDTSVIESYIYAEYIWLDNPFIEYFQKNQHMYVINQAEYHGDEIIPANATNYTTYLKFSNPSKELLVTFVDSNNINSNNYFNYSRPDGNSFLKYMTMYLNGITRFDNLPEFYYRCMFPESVHDCIPNKYIYTLPFSLKPQDNQPTGCLSMNVFTDITINFNLSSGNDSLYLYIYSLMYNFLTIKNGKLLFEYPI